ncbi:MAG: hypothetical protein JWQ01_4601, partial [Massilia sp.]|nr:hypothetical protein [Massilia sp.]
RYLDPVTAEVRILTVHAAYDPHEMGRLYVALCEEDAT